MKVAVIGYGVEGKSAVAYWRAKGAEVTICKRKEITQVPAGVTLRFGADYLKNLDQFDVITRTGSVHPSILLADNPNIEGKISTGIDEFLRVSPTKNIIGVTGTKGKGTTSTLIYKILQAAGKHVFLAGNIGSSPLDFIDQLSADSWVVLELSSYQLYDLKRSPHIAVCLMVTPEHLDWHGDTDDYIRSKKQLFAHQGKKDKAIYFSENPLSHDIAHVSPGVKIPYFAAPGAYVEKEKYIAINGTSICDVSEIRLLGKHNWQNICAAVTALWQVTQNAQAIRSVLLTFPGLPHRIEFVREINGVRYYNDSFATNTGATEAATLAIAGSKMLILGGFDRFLPLDKFAAFIKAHQKDLRHVLLIGQSAKRIAAEFEKVGFVNYTISTATTMHSVLNDTRKFAEPGDCVIFSPGFPSFDMFNNFEERGELFKKEVGLL